MFFLIPIGFLKVFHRYPWANLGLIATCVLLYVAQALTPDRSSWEQYLMLFPRTMPARLAAYAEPEAVAVWHQHAWTRQPWSLVTHAFLHGGIMHLVGNMAFLFVFGCAVNSEFGHAKYLLIFFTAALIAGIGYLVVGDMPMLGASGAICGITGLVAALYPRNDVRLAFFVWVIFVARVRVVEWPALFVVAGWFGLDLLGQLVLSNSSAIAYCAHLSGSVFGFALGVTALRVGWVVSDGNDFLTWYLGARVARKSKPRHRLWTGVGAPKIPPKLSAPRPAPDWDPIPLAGEEPSPGHEPIPLSAAGPRPVRRSSHEESAAYTVPVYRQLTEYFDGLPRGAKISGEDADRLCQWYEQYRRVHAGARISSKALLGMARLLAHRGQSDLALDAYDRVLRVGQLSRPALLALEAARYANSCGKRARARVLLKRALAGPLTPEHERLALELQAKLAHE